MSAAKSIGFGILSVMAGGVAIYALFAADRKRREVAHALPLTTALPLAFYRGQQYARGRCGRLVRTLLRLRATLVSEEMDAPSEDARSVLDDLGHELHLLGIDLWLGTPTNGARWIPDPIIGVGDMRPEWLREAEAIAALPRQCEYLRLECKMIQAQRSGDDDDAVREQMDDIWLAMPDADRHTIERSKTFTTPTAHAFEQGYQHEIAKSREVRESFVDLVRIWKRPIDQDVSALVHRATVAHAYQRIVAALERYGLACRPLPADWSFA